MFQSLPTRLGKAILSFWVADDSSSNRPILAVFHQRARYSASSGCIGRDRPRWGTPGEDRLDHAGACEMGDDEW